MRMFLVGMCDIFLILYLTTITGVDQRGVSTLTVEDYLKLKESREELKQRSDEQKEALAELEQRLALFNADQDALSREKKRLEAELARSANEQLTVIQERDKLEQDSLAAKERIKEVEQEAKEYQKSLAEAEQKKQEQVMKLKGLSAQIEQTEEEKALALRRAEKIEQDAELEKERFNDLLAQAKAASDKAKASEAEALARAEEAEQQRAKALAEAELAMEEAAAAEKSRRLAAARAERERVKSRDARLTALQAERKARIAEKGKNTAAKKLQSVTQPTERAIRKNVSPRRMRVKVSSSVKSLFGKSRKTRELVALPIEAENKIVVFFLIEDLLADRDSPGDYRDFQVAINGKPVERLFIRPSAPFVVAAVYPGRAPAGRLYSEPAASSTLMPTLIALRKDTELGLMDSLRGVGEDFYVFKRDQLQRSGSVFNYKVRGMRGTGEYAEYLLTGDQIVDLEGNLIGLVYKDNTVIPIRSLQGWHEITLKNLDPLDIVRQIQSAAGR